MVQKISLFFLSKQLSLRSLVVLETHNLILLQHTSEVDKALPVI